MKIGLMTEPLDFTPKTGIANYTYGLVNKILEIDTENEYVLIHDSPSDNKIYKNNKELLITPYKINIPKVGGLMNIIQRYYFNLIRLNDLDLIHTFSVPARFIIKPKAKVIETIYDLIPFIIPKVHTKPVIKEFKYFLPNDIKNADNIIAISECTKMDVIKYFNFPEDRIEVIYPSVDDRTYRPITDLDAESFRVKYNLPEKYVLFVGTLEPRKNAFTLIKAFSKVKKTGIPNKLVICGGEGWLNEKKRLFELVRDLNLIDEVIFTGYFPQEDLPKLYNCADLFVAPNIYDGFSLPLLEAMKCGIPVIASNTPALSEIIGNSGITFDPANDNELADKIYDVLTNETLANELRKKSLERAKMFSWDKSAKKTIKLYKKIYQKR